MFYKLSLSLLGLMALGVGCLSDSVATAFLPQATRVIASAADGETPITSGELRYEYSLSDQVGCFVNIRYPVLASSDLPENVEIAFEAWRFTFIARALGQSGEDLYVSTMEEALAEYMKTCMSEVDYFFANPEAVDPFINSNLRRSVDVTFDIPMNQKHLLSIGLHETSYDGSTIPVRASEYINLDRGNDKVLVLEDVIMPEQLMGIVATENFYLTPTALVTYYDSYTADPLATGPTTVGISYADILSAIAPSGPLYPVVEHLITTAAEPVFNPFPAPEPVLPVITPEPEPEVTPAS